MANILFTLAEDVDKTTSNHFAVRFQVDENDCFDFAAGLKELGHSVFFVNWKDLDGDKFTRMFDYNNSKFCDCLALNEFSLAFVYKMEGFYFDMPKFFEMVATFERNIAVVVNAPATIRHNIDKSYLFELHKLGVSVGCPYRIDDALRARLKDGETFVIKPLHGERGRDVFLAKSEADLEQIAEREDLFFAQKYMPEIRDGEKSLVYLGLEFQHAVIKKPNQKDASEFRCNESLGGTVAIYEPTLEELAYAEKLLCVYERFGCPVHFSRVDFVSTESGPTLIEVELLNPSIYANYSNKGKEFGAAIARYFDALICDTKLYLDWTCMSDSLTTDAFIELLGFVPTQFWMKGDPRPRTTIFYKTNGFRIRKIFKNARNKDILAQDFISEFCEPMKRVRDADSKARINFTFALYGYESEGFFLEPDYVRMLAETRSELNYDLYDWGHVNTGRRDSE